jgi:hypothetical protein
LGGVSTFSILTAKVSSEGRNFTGRRSINNSKYLIEEEIIQK